MSSNGEGVPPEGIRVLETMAQELRDHPALSNTISASDFIASRSLAADTVGKHPVAGKSCDSGNNPL